jgi:tetratricopeptide (TPR) repeat protein
MLLDLGQFVEVREWAEHALKNANSKLWPFDIGLNHLLLGRALTLDALRGGGDTAAADHHLNEAVAGLRKAAEQDCLPFALLARAAFRRQQGDQDKAQRDLDEAHRIAKRGGMRLHLIDCDLEAARLLLAEGRPKEEVRPLLDAARVAIAETGYHRRDPEVAALEQALA